MSLNLFKNNAHHIFNFSKTSLMDINKHMSFSIIKFNFSALLGIAVLSLSSCNKVLEKEESIPKFNAPLLIHSSAIVDIKATDVFNASDSFKRKIEIIDRRNHVVHDVFYITMKSNDFSSNIYTQIKNQIFTGTLSIVSDNQILFLEESKNGVIVNPSLSETNRIKSNLVPTCKVGIIHNCVAQKIRNMNIFEYGSCLATAPACYAELWGSCAFVDCIVGEQNRTNL
jgi:hypothetical protein